MKIRLGFVSNSSSSSYTCDLCGTESEASWDTPDGWRYCDTGHCLCEDEDVQEVNEEDFDTEEEYYAAVKTNNDSEMICPICSFKKVGVFDMDRYLQEVTNISREEVLAAVKLTNKRRRVLHTFDYQQYVSIKTGRTANQTEEEVLSRFKNYDEFLDFMKKE